MRRSDVRRAWSVLRWVLTLAILAFWFVALRPTGLGGPAAFAVVSGTSMEPRMHTGDLVIVHEHDRYELGDVVAYRVPEPDPNAGAQVIHRIVGGSGTKGFVVQGDNRDLPDLWRPTTRDIVGEQWVHIPRAGRVVGWIRTPIFVAAVAALVAVMLVLTSGSNAPKRDDERP